MGKKKRRSRSNTIVSTVRGGIYGLALGSRAISIAAHEGVNEDSIQHIAHSYAGMDLDGEFSWEEVKCTYLPVIVWGGIDFGLSKLGVWKKMGRLLK